MIRFEIEGRLIQRLTRLPDDWQSIPESVTTQRLGDDWIQGQSSLGLIVPSATLPEGQENDEQNVLLNPLYPKFLSSIKNPVVKPFGFDGRIHRLIGN
jgi:hypothetical protein